MIALPVSHVAIAPAGSEALIRFFGPGPLPLDPLAPPPAGLLRRIAERAAARPDHPAVDDGTNSLSYAALLAAAGSLAAVLAARTPPGAPVGLRFADSIAWPVALLACLGAGRLAVLLDAADPPARLAALAAESRLALLVTDAPVPGLPCLAPFGHPPAPLPLAPHPADRPAFLIWTSGSTGRPKGIVHGPASIAHRAGLLVATGRLGPGDRYLSLNTPASMGGLLNALAAFLAGATLHRVPLAGGGLGAVLGRIAGAGITAVIGVPALYRALARAAGDGAALASLRLLSSNGEALLAADLALLRAVLPRGCAVQMVYGATECQAALRLVPAEEVPDTPQVAVGWPVPGTRWAILDAEGRPVPPGEAGELVIESPYAALGEWQQGRCVPGRLTPAMPEGWRRYAMGDLVRQRADGALLVVGRIDRQLKLNGARVEPVEIEARLRTLPGVSDAAVLPLRRGQATELVGFLAAPQGFDVAAAAAALAAELPAAMRPRRLHRLAALPLLPGNKIDAAALAAFDAAAREAGR